VRIGNAGDDMIAILHGDRERLENKTEKGKVSVQIPETKRPRG
jgi:hypothetical protein